MPPQFYHILIYSLILIGFLVRLSFLLGGIYHVDEFITMLAATMVAETGLPILPSGLLYDHGLLYSFAAGLMIAWSGFTEFIARWPALLFSTLIIAAYYHAGQRLFNSRSSGVIAASIATFDELSILWGGRARMYSPAHLFVLLSLVWVLESTLKNPTSKGRYWGLLFLGLALLSHTVTMLILPPLGIWLLIASLLYRPDWLKQPGLWKQAVVGGVGLLIILAIIINGQINSTAANNPAETNSASPGFVDGFLQPGLEWRRFDDLTGYFIQPNYGWLIGLTGLGLLIVLYRLWHGSKQFTDVAFLFLLFFSLSMILEQGGLFNKQWQKTRYLFIIVQPVVMLLAGYSLTLILELVWQLITHLTKQPPGWRWSQPLIMLSGVSIVIFMWGHHGWDALDTAGTGNYNTAFRYVKEQLQPDDKIITVHPSAAYLYTGQSDYYASQESGRVLKSQVDDTENQLVDRYIGSPLVDTVAKFSHVLTTEKRVWFVVDEGRLFNQFDTFFNQQVISQMQFVQKFNDIFIFVSQPYPIPLTSEPPHLLQANLNNLISLGGYDLTLTPDRNLVVTLYWEPLGLPTEPTKVFVQLRNGAGETLAQADHFMYDGLLTMQEWSYLRDNEQWLRENSRLQLPIDSANQAGPYYLYVGLYNPETFERVPIIGDTSGEHAVKLEVVVE